MRAGRLGRFAEGMALQDHRMAQEAGDPAADNPGFHAMDTEVAVDRHRESAKVLGEAVGGIRGPGDLQEDIRAAGSEAGGSLVRAVVVDTVLQGTRIQDLAVGDMADVDIPEEGHSLGREALGEETCQNMSTRLRGDLYGARGWGLTVWRGILIVRHDIKE